MTGNIIGEELDEFVGKQVNTRQSIAGKGYDSLNPRSQTSQIYQNGRNAWVKLASGVNVIGDGIITDSEGVFDTSQVDTGEQRLIDIGLGANFSGLELAKKAVLFNGLAKVNPSSLKMKDGEYEIDETTQTPIIDQPGSYQFRQGVSKSKGFWNSGKAYGLGGTEFGLQPMPGIESVEVQALNRGSIRKATVTIKAFNKFQLDVIELLYLRLGYVMMLEWGWDKYYKDENTLVNTGNTIIEDYWFDQGKCTSLLKLYDFVRIYREKYNANYDGFVGRVTNYQWSFNSDGSYDVILEMYSIGDVIESLKSNIPVGDKTGATFTLNSSNSNSEEEYKEAIEAGEINKHRDNEICFWLWNTTKNLSNFEGINKNFFKIPRVVEQGPGGIGQSGFQQPTNLSTLNPENPSSQQSAIISNALTNPSPPKYQYFIRLGYFLEEFQERIIPYVAPCEKISDPILRIDTDIETNLISLHNDQFSLDPRVCIHNTENIFPSDTNNLLKTSTYPGKGLFIQGKGISGRLNFDGFRNNDIVRNALLPFAKNNTIDNGSQTIVTSGKLMNLYINYECIYQIFENNIDRNTGAISVFTFLSELCTEINGAFANTVQLEPIIDEGEVIKLIDLNPLVRKKAPKEDRTYFEIYGYSPESKSNFVRDLSFNTFIDGKLGSQLAIGAAAPGKNPKSYEGAGLQYWNRGLENRYINQLVLNQRPIIEEPNPQSEFDKSIKELGEYWDNANGIINLIVSGFVNYNPLSSNSVIAGVTPDISRPKTLRYEGKWYWNVYRWEFIQQAYSDNKLKKTNNRIEQGNQRFIISAALDYKTYIAYALGGKTSQGYATGQAGSNLTTKTIEYKDSYYFACDPNFIELGKSHWRNIITERENENSKVGNPPISYKGFIPLSFDLTLEGLSGIKIYNRLNLKQQFLPTQYKEGKFEYIIKQVNHQISDNDWTTQINSFSYPDLNANTLKRIGTLNSGSIEDTTPQPSNFNCPTDTLEYLRVLVAKGESAGYGDYDASNYLYKNNPTDQFNRVGNRSARSYPVSTFSIRTLIEKGQSSNQTMNQQEVLSAGLHFAVGRYQIIPEVLQEALNKNTQYTQGININSTYTPEVQEKLFEYLVFSKRPKLGAYILGNTDGLKTDLEETINSFALEFASIPRTGGSYGNVETGAGTVSRFGGSDSAKHTVGEVVQALISTRVCFTGQIPPYVPDYVILPTTAPERGITITNSNPILN